MQTDQSPSREAVAQLDLSPWADHHGPLPEYDSPVACVFDSGVQHAVELLAKELGVEDWTPCDGTEEYDGDLGGTLMNIVLAAMPKDKDGDPIHPNDLALLTPATPQPATGEVKEALAWYAEQAAGCRKISSAGDDARRALDKDGGERARNALARFERDHLTPATQADADREAAQAYFERGFLSCHAWHLTKKPGDQLSDAVMDHAWDHREEGGELPPIADATRPQVSDAVEVLRAQAAQFRKAAEQQGKKVGPRAASFEDAADYLSALRAQPSQAIPDVQPLEGYALFYKPPCGEWYAHSHKLYGTERYAEIAAKKFLGPETPIAIVPIPAAALAAPHPIARADDGEGERG